MTHPHQLTSAEDARRFVFAGNARLTLVSRKTGERFTYRVRAPQGDGPASHFVGVLTGPDNEGDYQYLGMYRRSRETGEPLCFEHGRKSVISTDADSAKAWRWFDAKVLHGSAIPEQLEVWSSGKCGRCGRTLTDPTSIARGIGPECANLMGA